MHKPTLSLKNTPAQIQAHIHTYSHAHTHTHTHTHTAQVPQALCHGHCGRRPCRLLQRPDGQSTAQKVNSHRPATGRYGRLKREYNSMCSICICQLRVWPSIFTSRYKPNAKRPLCRLDSGKNTAVPNSSVVLTGCVCICVWAPVRAHDKYQYGASMLATQTGPTREDPTNLHAASRCLQNHIISYMID
jgi:NADH:ubiquinone oxidoreductase subunit E